MFDFIKQMFHKDTTDFARLKREGAVIIDVRSTGEYLSGHIQGSRNIPLDTLAAKLNDLKRLHKPIVTVCRSGNRSASAKAMLTQAGIEAYNGGSWSGLNAKLS